MVLELPLLVCGPIYMKNLKGLTDIPNDIPDDVEKIYLSKNQIANIKSGIFIKKFSCISLQLDYNKLTEIRNDMLTGLVLLEWLSLEHNEIKTIYPFAFAGLPSLKGLYLHSNKLTTLPGNIFLLKQMPLIETLTLHQNNLNQDDLDWLRDLCDDGQIQKYTIGEDIIGEDIIQCTNKNNKKHGKRDQQIQTSSINTSTQLVTTPQG